MMLNLLLISVILIFTSKAQITGVNMSRQKAIDLIKVREGFRNKVYRDSLGNPTVGWGHLVTFSDGLQVGDVISSEKANELFKIDFEKAYDAALNQAIELNKLDDDFIATLASVNFQLGTNWIQKFPNTWKLLLNSDYKTALSNLDKSLWNKQTPTRVTDFKQAIERAYT